MEIKNRNLHVREPSVSMFVWLIGILGSLFSLSLFFSENNDSLYDLFFLGLGLSGILVGIFLSGIVYRYFDTRFHEVTISLSENSLMIPDYFLPKFSFRRKKVRIPLRNIKSCNVEMRTNSGTWTVKELKIQAEGFEKDIIFSSSLFSSAEDFDCLVKLLGCQS